MPPLFCAVSLARFNAVGERTSSFREQDRHLAEIEAALWRAKLSETCVSRRLKRLHQFRGEIAAALSNKLKRSNRPILVYITAQKTSSFFVDRCSQNL